MIVDSAHYKDGARQHEEALTPEQAAELRSAAGPGEFVWIGIHEPEPGDLRAAAGAVRAARARRRGRPEPTPAAEDRGLRRGRLHRPEDRPLPRGSRGGPLRRDPPLRRPRLRDHGAARAGQRARLGPAAAWRRGPTCSSSGPSSAVWAVLDKVVDDYIPVADAIEDDIEEVEKDVFDDDIPAPTARIYNLKREVIEFHRAVWPLLDPARDAGAGRLSSASPRSCAATSATSPTTPGGSTSRSAPSASCSPACCRPTSSLVSVNQNERRQEDLGGRRDHRRADLHRLASTA